MFSCSCTNKDAMKLLEDSCPCEMCKHQFVKPLIPYPTRQPKHISE